MLKLENKICHITGAGLELKEFYQEAKK